MVYHRDGFIGFYRGVIPPFFGSIIYRSLQFSAYEAVFTKCESNPNARKKVPFTGGIEYRVFYGGMASATARALVECPFEYAKVKRQTG
jgi:solute carrier family 25 carnitine/acylcarnitine transporter 20/29